MSFGESISDHKIILGACRNVVVGVVGVDNGKTIKVAILHRAHFVLQGKVSEHTTHDKTATTLLMRRGGFIPMATISYSR